MLVLSRVSTTTSVPVHPDVVVRGIRGMIVLKSRTNPFMLLILGSLLNSRRKGTVFSAWLTGPKSFAGQELGASRIR